MRSRLSILALLFVAPFTAASLSEQFPTFVDPKKAGKDFEVQGEYVAKVAQDKVKTAHQVLAEGNGKFTMWVKVGGLPGEPNHKESMPAFYALKLIDGKLHSEPSDPMVKSHPRHLSLTKPMSLDNGKLSYELSVGTREFEKTTRASPTFSAKPPEGAVILFDGKSADEWEKGQLVETNLLKMGVESKRKFQDFTLHIEFRTPFMPTAKGQDRGNSGVYLQNRYEVQVLDSFGLDVANNECGGIYKVAWPKINMCYPPLSWQTYDMDFIAARFDAAGKKTADAVLTVMHNGVVIHDKLKLPGPTAGGNDETPEPGPIHLQDHGNPVYYRNIWVVEKRAGGS